MFGISKWDLFTPVMHLLDPFRRPTIRHALRLLHARHPLTPETSLLDVGCGTGTVLTELLPYGCQLTAAEPTGAMVRYVERNFHSVRVLNEPAHAMTSVADHSQDVSLISATLHGLPPEYRRQVYPELRRVTRGLVVVLDYHLNYNPAVALVEALEGGDYFRFIRTVEQELGQELGRVERIPVSGTESLYLCRPE
jgi:SAM-dependent methyltransferase